MNWLLIGSSPSVLEYLPRVRQECRIDRTITCNSGIELEPFPDVYCCVDSISQKRFSSAAREAQKQGTRLICLKRTPQALRNRDCDWYDEFIENGQGKPTRSKWGAFRYSGPLCVEYACRNGATTVYLVGCDGYSNQQPEQYFNGFRSTTCIPRDGLYQRCTVEVLQPAFQHIAELWHDVRFVQYGDPFYAIAGDNWTVRGTGLGSLREWT